MSLFGDLSSLFKKTVKEKQEPGPKIEPGSTPKAPPPPKVDLSKLEIQAREIIAEAREQAAKIREESTRIREESIGIQANIDRKQAEVEKLSLIHI